MVFRKRIKWAIHRLMLQAITIVVAYPALGRNLQYANKTFHSSSETRFGVSHFNWSLLFTNKLYLVNKSVSHFMPAIYSFMHVMHAMQGNMS